MMVLEKKDEEMTVDDVEPTRPREAVSQTKTRMHYKINADLSYLILTAFVIFFIYLITYRYLLATFF